MSEKEILNGLKEAVETKDQEKAEEYAEKAIEQKIEPFKAISEGLAAGMNTISEQFDKAEIYLPQVTQAADAMKSALNVLKPKLDESDKKSKGTIIIGTVEGDIHEIGKNVVIAMLEGAGFNVIDLGKDVTEKEFINKAEAENAEIIAASALMSTTKPNQKDIVQEIQKRELPTKTLFGGAPVTEKWVEEINGDAYAPNAAKATETAENLLN
ncbi:MAG: Trimethylamine corrinoid protein MtbC1 [Candidatus Methanohalarchaeum thermophilum]|uniref:Trimethylamine corrinoid protein MtbC1 n=1 Tax=Methanohalarchaeum thermophilum TaxID=1903181 RepID=A0A1Q6DT48_METT1|nr:MAG: Trimethylamine corrinoid protein MtbC1 [Candidatus Methanohalarchaeum thermophilum]